MEVLPLARSRKKLIEDGVKISDSLIYRKDKIWSRYSNDKVDIGETLARVIRTLSKYMPVDRDLNALSVGSSNEPQFRILQSAFAGNLFLLDIEKEALAAVKERIQRQDTRNVVTVLGDFNKSLANINKVQTFREKRLLGKRLELITFQHSLYYQKFKKWPAFIENIFKCLLAPQ